MKERDRHPLPPLASVSVYQRVHSHKCVCIHQTDSYEKRKSSILNQNIALSGILRPKGI